MQPSGAERTNLGKSEGGDEEGAGGKASVWEWMLNTSGQEGEDYSAGPPHPSSKRGRGDGTKSCSVS